MLLEMKKFNYRAVRFAISPAHRNDFECFKTFCARMSAGTLKTPQDLPLGIASLSRSRFHFKPFTILVKSIRTAA